MLWHVELCDAFLLEFYRLPEAVQDELMVQAKLLRRTGPQLGRPHIDTLKGSKHSNMKELRFKAHGSIWRVAFAFDWHRKAILLVGGSKSGVSQRRFYNVLIKVADARFDQHLADLGEERGNG